MKSTHGRGYYLRLAILAGLALTLITTAIATSHPIGTSAPAHQAGYQPTASEAPMFKHLRPATVQESQEGGWALTNAEFGTHPHFDVYVAVSSFNTVYTAHPMIILVNPGVQWLGGQLGQIYLVLRVTDQDYQASWTHNAQTKYDIQHFAGAQVIYNPFCMMEAVGAATLDACKASPQQRHATAESADPNSLQPMTSAEIKPLDRDQVLDLPYSPWSIMHWTSLAAQDTVITPDQGPYSVGGKSLYQVTVLHPGQRLTGGELGTRFLVLPSSYRAYYNDAHYDTRRIVVTDPIPGLCNPVRSDYAFRSYLGPAVIAAYCK